MSEWTKVMGRFHWFEIADLENDPNFKIEKTDKHAFPFPGSPPEAMKDTQLYVIYERSTG